MDRYLQECGIHHSCSSIPTYVCKCELTVVLLCNQCLPSHILKPCPHLLIKFHHYINSFDSDCLRKDSWYHFLKHILTLPNTLDLTTSTELLPTDIYQDTQQVLPKIRRFIHLSHTATLSKSYLKDLTHKIHQSNPEILASKKFALSLDSLQLKRYLISASNNSKKLVEYDTDTNITTSYDLSSSVTYDFDCSATCILPNGDILISGVGFVVKIPLPGSYYPIEDTYRVNISSQPIKCTKLGNLNYPRWDVKLICHNDSVYAFGGYCYSLSQKVERLSSAYGTQWSEMSDMIDGRSNCGHYIYRNRIYLIGGNDGSIECYDILRNTSRMVMRGVVPLECVVGYIDRRIYVVGKYDINVFSKEFELRESYKINNKSSHFYLGFSNSVLKDGRFINACYGSRVISIIDANRRSIEYIETIR